MKWQVLQIGSLTGLKLFKSVVGYYDPNKYHLMMRKCKLNNVSRVAEKIFSGSHKTVCAWISCEDLDVLPVSPEIKSEGLQNIIYNPKKAPYWSLENINVDNNNYESLITINNKVYIKL